MDEKSRKLQEISDAIAMEFFGRTVSEAHEGCVCVTCGKLVLEFRDERSKREYGLSGLCQACQDKTLGVEA